MAFFSAFANAWLALAACAALGALTRRTPIYFAPATGLAAATLLATVCGWLTPLSAAFTRSATVVVLAAALWIARRRLRKEVMLVLWLGPVALAAAWPLWAGLLRCGSFDVYNDAFTYLVHAAWLRDHSFRETPRSFDLYPALTQVALYQQLDLRMGASFVFAWLHGLCGAARSLAVYPAAVALGCGTGLLAVAGILRRTTGRHAGLCLAASLIPAVAQSGVSFATAFGFLPQTFGLSFAVAAFGLLAEGAVAGAALCLAAHAVAYPEALPFTLASCAVYFFTRERRTAAFALAGAALLSLPELPRLFRGMAVQASAQVGTVNSIDLRDAVIHVAGFAGGPWEGWTRLIDPGWVSAILAAAILIAALAGLRLTRNRIHLAPLVALALLLGTAFLWFRFIENHSWRQSKAAGWATWPVMLLVIAGLLALAERGPRARVASVALLFLWLAAGFFRHWQLAEARPVALGAHTGLSHNHFEAYERAASALRSLPPGDPVLLEGFPTPRDKHRELLTYFVMDSRPLLSDWTGDDYIAPVLKRPDTRRPGVPWVVGPDMKPRRAP